MRNTLLIIVWVTEPSEQNNLFLIVSYAVQQHNLIDLISVGFMHAAVFPFVATTILVHTFGTMQGRTSTIKEVCFFSETENWPS